MIVVGIDSHKKTHTLVAVDQAGKRLTQLTVDATAKGHRQVCVWLRQFEQVMLAIEDCRHLTRRFEADLLLAGHAVVRVHTRLMAGARRSARERGKSDPIDAKAVARVALREPDLPRAELDGPTREVKLRSDHRRTLVRQRTAIANKLRWFLHEIDPELAVPSACGGCASLTPWKRTSRPAAESCRRSRWIWFRTAGVCPYASTRWRRSCAIWSANSLPACWRCPAAGSCLRR